jgi:hypothetical protein
MIRLSQVGRVTSRAPRTWLGSWDSIDPNDRHAPPRRNELESYILVTLVPGYSMVPWWWTGLHYEGRTKP